MLSPRSGRLHAACAFSRKPGPMWSKAGGRQEQGRADEIDRREGLVLAVDPQVVRARRSRRTTRRRAPAARASGLLDHRRDVVGPEAPVAVVAGLGGALGQPVAPKVEGDDPKPRCEIAADLLGPAEIAL